MAHVESQKKDLKYVIQVLVHLITIANFVIKKVK
jgi:hypothetical protein